MRTAPASSAFVLVVWLAGCTGEQVCEPGESQPCTCADGSSGAQECSDDGDAWEDCTCLGDDDTGDDDTGDDDTTGGDADGDGWTVEEGDCDDDDPAVHPLAEELCDGLDNNCDGAPDSGEVLDQDGDGYVFCEDCDDLAPESYPGAPELCDGIDNDCDGALPMDEETDSDGDGWVECLDCNDDDEATHPDAAELCDGVDNDCNGDLPTDEQDSDSDSQMVCAGDCDDSDPDTWDGAGEICDGIDNDCDGALPDDEQDGDSDGVMACDGDCDDGDPAVFPGATETCNGMDDDCDGQVPAEEQLDADGDGYFNCEDCDDTDELVYPGAPESCDGIDGDCDGVVPEDETDDDLDGWSECEGDCDDSDAALSPDADELCDGIDNDCDGTVDYWISIPGGSFDMGSDEGEADEIPVHTVTVPDLEMWQTEVTVAQYQECIDTMICTSPDSGGTYDNWGVMGREQHPVNSVDWYQAATFCAWVGGRLPTEAEWEYAARSGGQDLTYPWGDEDATCDLVIRCDWGMGGYGCGEGHTWEVCSKPDGNTDQGLCDMAGNVWEWVQDWYHSDYTDAPVDGSAWETPEGDRRPFRGGGFASGGDELRCSNRDYDYPTYRVNGVGFRCAR